MIFILLLGLFCLFLSFMMWMENDVVLSLPVAAIGIILIFMSCWNLFLRKDPIPPEVPATIPSSITTNCETLLSKDGTVRVDIYTIRTNIVSNTVKLEKE
jgi:hypothetical protein